jgi:hypothetical protein
MRASWPAHLDLVDLITLIIFGEAYIFMGLSMKVVRSANNELFKVLSGIRSIGLY